MRAVVLTEVSQFELPTVIDEEVLGFEVSMENFASVTVAQSSQKLEQEELHTNTQSNTAFTQQAYSRV